MGKKFNDVPIWLENDGLITSDNEEEKEKISDQIVQDNIDPVEQVLENNEKESEVQDITDSVEKESKKLNSESTFSLPKPVQKQKKISNFFFKTSLRKQGEKTTEKSEKTVKFSCDHCGFLVLTSQAKSVHEMFCKNNPFCANLHPFFFLFLWKNLRTGQYGNTACGVFKRGVQN